MNCEPIIVKQRTSGNLFYVTVALIMSLLSITLTFIDISLAGGILRTIAQSEIMYFLLKAIFVIGFLFFGYVAFFLIKRAIKGKAVLIVDQYGITDNSSAVSFGFIPWSDIDDIYVDCLYGNDFIELVINNEDKYIGEYNSCRKKLLSINKKIGHQIVCITLNSTGVSPHALLPKIQEIYMQSKTNNPGREFDFHDI